LGKFPRLRDAHCARYRLRMSAEKPFQFVFVRRRFASLSDAEIDAMESRVARLLDVLSEVAMAASAQSAAEDKRFDESAPAPYDSSPSNDV